MTTVFVLYQADVTYDAGPSRGLTTYGSTKLGLPVALLAELADGDVRLRIFTSRPLQLEFQESNLPPVTGTTNPRRMTPCTTFILHRIPTWLDPGLLDGPASPSNDSLEYCRR